MGTLPELSPLEWLQVGLLALLLALTLVGGVDAFRFHQYLKRRHRQFWVELGEPTMFWNSSFKTQRAVSGFLTSERHTELGDPELSRLVRRLRWMGRVGLVLFLVFAATNMLPWLRQWLGAGSG